MKGPKMTLSDSMLAMEISAPGGPDVLRPVSLPVPVPGQGHIVIRLAFVGVNRPDALQRAGNYAPPPSASPLPGLEGAGTVVAMGPGATRWQIGDKVCALLPGGGYAEYAVVDAGSLLPVPEGIEFAQAAALPETVFTVWANVFEIGALKPGETLAVHGATSGIGTTAIQMARAFGAKVVGTSRGQAKTEATQALGVDLALDSTAPDFAARLADACPDVILDMVGGAFLKTNLEALNFGGRLVIIAFQGGATGEADLARVMRNRLTITGSTLRARPVTEKARLARAVEQTVWPWLTDGRLRPVIEAELPLDQAGEAHRRLEAGTVTGKVVLVP